MKTTIFSSLMLLSLNGLTSWAGNEPTVKPVAESVLKLDSTAIKPQIFEFQLDPESLQLTVFVEGFASEFASVSITNSRGASYLFRLVDAGQNQLQFDLSELEEGSYFIVLNVSEEIRMKRLMLKHE